MVEYAKQVLKEMEYSKLSKVEPSLFDDEADFHGWHFFAERIFELPRSERFMHLLEQRYNLAQERDKQKRRNKKKKKIGEDTPGNVKKSLLAVKANHNTSMTVTSVANSRGEGESKMSNSPRNKKSVASSPKASQQQQQRN